MFNEPVEKSKPVVLFCNVDTETTVLNDAPNISVKVTKLNPALSLNVFGIVLPIKLKFTLSIVPCPEVEVAVV